SWKLAKSGKNSVAWSCAGRCSEPNFGRLMSSGLSMPLTSHFRPSRIKSLLPARLQRGHGYPALFLGDEDCCCSRRSIKAERSPSARTQFTRLPRRRPPNLGRHTRRCWRVLRHGTLIVVEQCPPLIVWKDHDFGSDADATVQIDDVGVLQPDASARYVLADGARIIGAVDAIFGIAEIKRPRSQRIAGTAADPARQIGLARHHLRRRDPIRPFGLANDCFNSRPGEALASDADAIAHRHAVAERQIKESVPGIDDDGARRLIARIRNHLPA